MKRKTKCIKWDGQIFYLKLIDGTEKQLGGIPTALGQLTRAQKLRAIEHANEWVRVNPDGVIVPSAKD